jgi:putative ABC transport system permease protein
MESVKERYRDQRGLPWIETTWADTQYAIRMLRKSPGFAAVAVTMLALGIGVNGAVFTITNAVLFKGFPLVFRNNRVLYITTNKGSVDYPDFEDWRKQATSFKEMALARGIFSTLDSPGGGPEAYYTKQVTPNIFQLVGVKPILGRDFTASDAKLGAAPTVILRYSLWEQRFGKNPAIIGQIVRLNGVPTTVIGVMPPGFSFPENQSLWIPLVPPRDALRRGSFGAQYIFGRMEDGATIQSVRAEMETIGRRLASAYPRTNEGVVPVVKTFSEFFIGANATTVYKSLWGAVGFVLLIACANLANLLLGRATGRSREIAIRAALGAGQRRIVRQLLVESLMLSSLGGIFGWWIARNSVKLYALAAGGYGVSNAIPGTGNVLDYAMDSRVFAYMIAISIGTGILFGLAPALRLSKLDVNATLKDGDRGATGGRRGKRLSGLLVIGEMATTVMLLVGAGVLIQSFLNVYTADVGVDARNVVMIDLYTPPEAFANLDAQISFYRDVEVRLQALPGVESVGFGAAPTEPVARIAYELPDAPPVEERSRPAVAEIVVSSDYFRTLGARMISGREFNNFDRASSMPVAIVNQQFADRNWPGEVSLGKRLRLFAPGEKSSPWLTVVGVVSNIVQNDRTRQAFDPLVYVPGAQHRGVGAYTFVRTSVALGSIGDAIRRQIYAVDPYQRVPVLRPLAERLDLALAFQRNIAALFLIFAGIALLLAAVGLYAVVAHSVSRRTQEIGLRMAMGATSNDVFQLVLRQGIPSVGVGLAIGLAASFAVNRVLKAELVQVSPNDPATLFIASALLVLSAALGCLIPAHRAMRVDPAVALRHE